MEILHPNCAGADVHLKTVVVCAVWRAGEKRRQETRTFATTTGALLELLDWLLELGITHLAIESTGVYWKPVYYVLEGHLAVWLVNAQHVKNVPGRKTDVCDAEWLASLQEHGLVRASFIPPRPQRELRDLTRQRANLVRDRTQVLNRLQKILEDANIKLAAVVSDVNGVSALEMLRRLVGGTTDAKALAELARGSLRKKRAELEAALTGRFREHHRYLLRHALTQLDFLEEEIHTFSEEIERRLSDLSREEAPAGAADGPAAPGEVLPAPAAPGSDRPAEFPRPVSYGRAVELWDSMPGVNRRAAEVLVAEIGPDMRQFPTPPQLASWVGVCPGNNESAGKRRSGAIAAGDRPARKMLVQCAHAAAHTKGSYLQRLYHRLAARRGKQRALMAVAHAMAVSAWHMLGRDELYREPQPVDLSLLEKERLKRRMVKRLLKMGYEVDITRSPAAEATSVPPAGPPAGT